MRHVGVTQQPEFLLALGTDEYPLDRAEAVRLHQALGEVLRLRQPAIVSYSSWCAAVSKAFDEIGEDAASVGRLRLFNIMQNNGWIVDERYVRRAGDC